MAKPEKFSTPVIKNRKAYYNYFIDEELEAGIVLTGCEVKVIRQGSFTIAEGYCELRGGELWLVGATIPEYKQGTSQIDYDPTRRRKLLLHRHELGRMARKVQEKGCTIVPLKAYFVDGKVKLKVGLAKGKRQYDKRDTIKRRDVERDTQRKMK